MGNKRSYHHGDLHTALLRSAVTQIAESGVGNMSVRALARKVGVAHRAAYQHFPNKGALVAAALSMGYDELETRITAASNKETSATENLVAIAIAYADFAFAQRNMFFAMTGPRINDKGIYPVLEEALNRNWRLITTPIDEGIISGEFNIDDKQAAAVVFWGGLQGVITQVLLGRIKLKSDQRTGFFKTTAERFVRMLNS